MDVPRMTTILTIAAFSALPAASLAAEQKPSFPQSTTPIDRGYGQHDACFGDKFETEDDMKTGNEDEVMQILKQMLGPGT
ncbi:MAG: hypothetical protein JJ900_18145 [Rhodospirillales bacterium]|nr:hypothetical protein [Rhodospirillales bacterium]MBO6788774.1 hypothetical protein [Rhodospirillales bacterium]